MPFNPKFTITPKINKALVEIERVRGFLDAVKRKDRKCVLKDQPIFERINTSMFLGNRTSHDSGFSENIHDLKMFYDDVSELEGLFRCAQCNNLISKKHYDDVENTVKCSCGVLKDSWKK